MKKFAVFLSMGLASGCTTARHIDVAGRPTLTSIVNHIQCEVYNAWDSYKRVTKGEEWLAAVTLSLSETTAGSLGPSVSTGDVADLTIPRTVVSASFNFNKSRQSTESYDFVIDIKKINPDVCKADGDSDPLLGGDIGIRGVVASGLGALKQDTYSTSLDVTEAKAFGKSITVTLNRQVSGLGPTWTLDHFSGPGPFLGFTGQSIDIVNISFTKVAATKPTSQARRAAAPSAAKTDAARRASDYNTKFQLQQLLQQSPY
jgi:hypothetical protein